MVTKSQAAFRLTSEGLFQKFPRVYFWTLTFSALHSDWDGSKLFSAFLNHLREVVGRTGWGGVRVVELHKERGIHYHMLVTERLAVDLVRSVGRCHGIGRIQVKRADEGSIGYLAKYLTKQRTGPIHESGRAMRRWAAFGDVPRVRKNDLVNDSPVWVYRREHNLFWLGYAAERLLGRCWDFGPKLFHMAWQCAKSGDRPGDLALMCQGKLTADSGKLAFRCPVNEPF